MRLPTAVAAGLLAFVLAGPAVADDSGVTRTFDGYRLAVLDGRGAVAGALISAATRDFYDAARLAALAATPQDIERMSLIEAVLVVRLRAVLAPHELSTLDGAGVFAAAATRGLVGSGFADLRLGPVEAYGDHAVAEQLDAAGRPSGVWWRFVREAGAWRVNLRPNLDAADAVLRERLHASGMTRADFLNQLANNGR